MSQAQHPAHLLSITSEIAREAGAVLMRFFRQNVRVEYKGEADLVTVADRTSEELITKRLNQHFPAHDILGEEGGLSGSGSDYRWYVDPLDGTTNFAHGYPAFCVSMGLEFQGERILGVVFDPTRDEMFTAEKGKGAHLNGTPIHVSPAAKLSECLLATGFPSKKRHKNPNIHFYHQLSLRTHGVRRAGSAALDLVNVASGRFDGFWEFNLNPWDTAAGVLIVQEAGGMVTGVKGQPFEIASKETIATNGLIHAALLAEFDAIFAGRDQEPLPSPADYARTGEF
jgi:myo-inositol-1(or 4)-monophosphatase